MPQQQQAQQGQNKQFTISRKLARAKLAEFSLIGAGTKSKFIFGYRNREDITDLPPGVLVKGSQNVLTNVSGRIGTRKGYTLDGAAANPVNIFPVRSAYDWEMHTGVIQHLRVWSTNMEYRFVNATGAVSWISLLATLASDIVNFAEFWSTTNSQAYLLFVDGESKIYEWSGGNATFASATANTVTKQGVETFAENGFYSDASSHKFLMAGIEYTYTGGVGTTTLTGVTPNPTAGTQAVGDSIIQSVESTTNASMTSLPAALENDLISFLQNQVYVGSLRARTVYVSKVNNYKDFSFTSPVRKVGEGALVTLDGTPVAFAPQEDKMYVAAGKDQWYETVFTLSSDLANEALQITRLKTTVLQGAQSQKLVGKIPNDVLFVSNEPILNTLGRVSGVINTPQTSDISFPIINDMNGYDFTDGQVFFHRNYIYMSVPQSGIIRIFNQTNPKNHYWEAPQTIPISCFSIIDGELYGHSYLVPETYKLFTGYVDGAGGENHPIDTRALFSYMSFGSRHLSKFFNKQYFEGYISQPTTLNLITQYDMDGKARTVTKTINGNDSAIVALSQDKASLGKESLGKNPLGGDLAQLTPDQLPANFQVIKTYNKASFFKMQPSFTSLGVNQVWELLCFGPSQQSTSEGQNNITQ